MKSLRWRLALAEVWLVAFALIAFQSAHSHPLVFP